MVVEGGHADSEEADFAVFEVQAVDEQVNDVGDFVGVLGEMIEGD